jgi:hypothetical protein
MKVAIIVHRISKIKCDLTQLCPNEPTRFILLATKEVIYALSPSNRNFFEAIHSFMDDEYIEPEFLTPIIQQYINEVGRENVTLLADSEQTIITLGKLNEQLGLKGPTMKEIFAFTDKLEMKNCVAKAGLRIPRHVHFDRLAYQENPETYLAEISKYLAYPLIAKPTNLYCSHSVTICHDAKDFAKWAEEQLTSSIDFEIDEYIQGILYHCEAIVRGGKIIYEIASEYTYPNALFGKGYPLGTCRILPSHPSWKKLIEFNRQVIAAMPTPDGATHCEIFEKENGELIFLEIAARAPGGLVAVVHERATGINLELEHFKAYLNIPTAIRDEPCSEYFAWVFIPKRTGKVLALTPIECASTLDIRWYIEVGSKIRQIELGSAGIIFRDDAIALSIVLHHADFATLYQDFLRLKTHQWFTVA